MGKNKETIILKIEIYVDEEGMGSNIKTVPRDDQEEQGVSFEEVLMAKKLVKGHFKKIIKSIKN